MSLVSSILPNNKQKNLTLLQWYLQSIIFILSFQTLQATFPKIESWIYFYQQLIIKLLTLFDTATMYVGKCATAFLRFSPHLAVIAPRAPPQQERPLHYRDKAFINSYPIYFSYGICIEIWVRLQKQFDPIVPFSRTTALLHV